MRVRNRISNRLLNSPLRAMRFGVARPCLLKSLANSYPNIVLTILLANLRNLKLAAFLASCYLTLNCVDAMFVRATVL